MTSTFAAVARGDASLGAAPVVAAGAPSGSAKRVLLPLQTAGEKPDGTWLAELDAPSE
jgi:hypothetical protein